MTQSSTSTLPRRKLGQNGPEVPVLAFGSWNTWDRMEREDALAVLDAAISSGATFFDVAHYNMGPHAENARTDIIFGELVRELGLRREQWQICGKLWLWDYPRTSFRQQMETSLERIGIEKADMIVVGDYLEPLDIRQVVTDMAEQIEAGHFDHWGVNNWHIEDLRTALDFAAAEGLTPPCFAQLKYGPARRSMAEGPHYAPLFERGLGLQASDVFEGGVLLGTRAPQRKIGADVGGIREQILAAAPQLAAAAARLGASPAQLAIAFCLAHPAVGNVLVGTSRMSQLRDNLGAVEVLEQVGADTVRAELASLRADRGVPSDGTFPAP